MRDAYGGKGEPGGWKQTGGGMPERGGQGMLIALEIRGGGLRGDAQEK